MLLFKKKFALTCRLFSINTYCMKSIAFACFSYARMKIAYSKLYRVSGPLETLNMYMRTGELYRISGVRTSVIYNPEKQ